MASVYSCVMNSLSVLIFSPNMNPVITSYLEAICPACGNKAAVCVDVTLLWERIQLLRWAGWLTLGKVCEPVSPYLNKEVELNAGKRPIWEIKYQGATWALTLHVLGYFREVLVSIQILVFAGDRNPARLSWGRKTNFSQGRGLPNSRNNPRQGFKPFPDTLPPTCPWLLSPDELCSLRSASLVSLKKFAKPLKSSGPGEQANVPGSRYSNHEVGWREGQLPQRRGSKLEPLESLPSLLSPTFPSAPHVLAGPFYSWSFCPASLSLRANCLGSNIPPYLCSQSSLNPSVPRKDNSSCLLWPVDRFFFPMRLRAPQRPQLP